MICAPEIWYTLQMIDRLHSSTDLYKAPTWSDLDLPPFLQTDQGRLEGFLNVAHSGAKSLEILVMSRDYDAPPRIINRIQALTGIKISTHTNTKNHFNYGLERLGVVERGERRGWRLTPFGEAIKPAVIFFWGQLLDLGTHPMALLNASSQGTKDSEGNILTTAALTRSKVLHSLYQHGAQSCIVLAEDIGFNFASMNDHINELDLEGITTTASKDILGGQTYLKYGTTTRGVIFND